MGFNLTNPIIVTSCNFTGTLVGIKKYAGAKAVQICSTIYQNGFE